MFRFSAGEKLKIFIIILLLIVNPVYALIYQIVFSWYKLKDYKIRDWLLLTIIILASLNLIVELPAIGYNYYNLFAGNDITYSKYLMVTVSPRLLFGIIPFLFAMPYFNYKMIRKYYNLEETMEERIFESSFKVKESERSIFDEKVKTVNSQMEVKDKLYRLGVNRNLEKIYFDENSQNCAIVGSTGTGKSNTVMNIVHDSLEQGNHLIYVNGKGNMEDTNKVIDMCKKRNKDYILISIGEDNEIKYNPFKNANATTIRDMLLALTDWSEEHYKSNASAYYQVVLNLLNLERFNIYQFLSTMQDDEALKIEQQKRDIDKWLKKANLEILKNKDVVATSLPRIMQLFGGEGEKIFSKEGIDIQTAIAQDKAVIINLNPNNYAETSKVLFRLITLDIRKSFEVLDGNTRIITTIMEEYAGYATDDFINVMNQGRSSGYKIYPTAQSPADTKYEVGEDFLDRVMDNCNSFLFARVNSPQSASYLADVIGTVEKMQITRVTNEMVEGDKGTARKVHQYIVHPSDIKYMGIGEIIYCNKDKKQVEYVYTRHFQ